MKLRFCIFAALVVLCCVLPGCKQEEAYYRTYNENGEWYLQFTREIPDAGILYGIRDMPSEYDANVPIRFESVLEMARTVKSGALSLEWLDYLAKGTYGDVLQIVDLDALYEPVLPNNVESSDHVYMDLSVCEFELEGNGSNTNGVFEIRYGIPYYPIIPEGETVKYQLELNDSTADRKARDIIFEECGINATSKSPELCYRLISGEDTYTVREIGWHKIMILAEWEGVSIFVSLRGLEEIPTLDWIAQFGIKPLEGAY